MRSAFIIVFVFVSALLAPARKQSSTRKVKPAVETQTTAYADTIAADSAMVTLHGYEKTLRATKETFFITNTTKRRISAVELSITYLDSSERTLHERTEIVRLDIPPGETRRADIKSWDTQRTFYYIHSPRPRVSAIPYSVRITPLKIITEK